MTNEEAITGLKYLKTLHENSQLTCEALNIAIKAINRRIPRKPKYKTKINTVQGFQCEDIYVLCPSCNNRIYSIVDGEAVAGKKQKCCDNCGQALDWGDEK